jgi:large subunit ribosomal protein L23
MELGIYDIIKGIVLTPKSTIEYRKLGKITLQIHRAANKAMVKNAVEKIWDVKVDSVNVVTVPGKTKRFSGKSFVTSKRKKAIVTLKKGYKIELPGHVDVGTETPPPQFAAGARGGEEK